MISGTPVKLRGQVYVIPPLTLGQLRSGLAEKMKEHDRLVRENQEDSGRDNAFAISILRGEIIHAALSRNYPEIDEARCFELLDLGNVSFAWLAVIGLSGFRPGEEEAGAEAEAPGTSNPSIPPSQEPTDGTSA